MVKLGGQHYYTYLCTAVLKCQVAVLFLLVHFNGGEHRGARLIFLIIKKVIRR